MSNVYPDSGRVAVSFSNSAERYDTHAYLQTEVADNLLAQTPFGARVLDLGCGTGRNTALMAQYPEIQQLTALDIAKGMLAVAQARVHRPVDWLHADVRNIPLPDDSLDTVFSSLVLQWLGPESVVFEELFRVLAPGGHVSFSTLLPGTLFELKQAWQQIDSAVHVNHFEPQQAWLKAAETAGFVVQQQVSQKHVRYFESALASMRELKNLGARNLNQSQPKGLMGRQRIMALSDAYESFRQPQGLPATYQVLYVVVEKPL